MQKLQDIAVRVEATDGPPLNHSNATPIMHEILHALKRLAEEGLSTTIDLLAMPFGPGDEQELLSSLGAGEIRIEMDSLGRSLIRETSLGGVWLVDHRNADGQRIALQLEITPIPSILLAPSEDVREAIARLQDWLNLSSTKTTGA